MLPRPLVSVLAYSAMPDQYRNLTTDQPRQELAARDARIGELEQTVIAERRAIHELQDAVNYLQEQQVYALLLERQQLLLCFATCAAQAAAFVGGMQTLHTPNSETNRYWGSHNLASIRSNASFSTSAPVSAGYVQTSKLDLSAASNPPCKLGCTSCVP